MGLKSACSRTAVGHFTAENGRRGGAHQLGRWCGKEGRGSALSCRSLGERSGELTFLARTRSLFEVSKLPNSRGEKKRRRGSKGNAELVFSPILLTAEPRVVTLLNTSEPSL